MRKHILTLIMALFLSGNSDFCCAENQADRDFPSPRKSYGVAMAISFFAPGGGTIYAGKTIRGGIELGSTALAIGLMASAGSDESWQGSNESWRGIMGVTLFSLTWIVSMVDAPIAVWQHNKEQRTAVLFAPAKQLADTPPNGNFHIQLCSLRF